MDSQTNTYDVVETPWGSWKLVHEESSRAVKVLTVNPGCMLSLQSHQQRDEYWVALNAGLVAYVLDNNAVSDGQHATSLVPFKPLKIRRGEAHRLINPTNYPITIVEIIAGNYLESDIKRLHDAYGRE